MPFTDGNWHADGDNPTGEEKNEGNKEPGTTNAMDDVSHLSLLFY